MTAVNTAHSGKVRCRTWARTRAASAAIVALIESANCARRRPTSARSLLHSFLPRVTLTVPEANFGAHAREPCATVKELHQWRVAFRMASGVKRARHLWFH